MSVASGKEHDPLWGWKHEASAITIPSQPLLLSGKETTLRTAMWGGKSPVFEIKQTWV